MLSRRRIIEELELYVKKFQEKNIFYENVAKK
jgi:hypothetical protein